MRMKMTVVMMQVRYFLRGGQQAGLNTTLTTRKEELEISGLAEKTEYGFQVRHTESRPPHSSSLGVCMYEEAPDAQRWNFCPGVIL